MTLDHVFRAGAIGPLSLDHRIVMGSMHLGLESRDDDGRALAAFYAERARGGAALIVTGGSAVSRVGAAGRGYSFVNEDAERSKLARVAEAVHQAGGRILLQLFHAGRYAIQEAFDLQPVAPSPVYAALVRTQPRELTGAEVLQTIEDFAAGAARARELGFDGVEIMGSEGYLLNQFTAPLTNRRDDEWGGDRERRLAFPLAVSGAVRAAIGSDRAVVYRISAADLVEGGTPAEDVVELAARLADPDPDRPGVGTARGVDALGAGIGWHEARIPTVQQAVPEGAWVPWARALRHVASVPVIAANRVNTLELAEEVLATRGADFVSLARPFLADPEIVAKGLLRRRASGGAGHLTEPGVPSDAQRPAQTTAVNVCIACDQACIDRSLFDQRVSCVVNPRAGFELELGPGADPDLCGRRVAVVGGGPAGMEASRALARAGAAVTLYEAGSRLGGQFRMAARIPGKQVYASTAEYFEAELPRLGVEVALETLPALELLRAADAVILATGVTPRPVDIPGAELPHVHTYAELLDPDADPVRLASEAPVAIIGAGGIGVDVAHLLSHREGGDPLRRFYAEYGLRPPSGAAPGAGAALGSGAPREEAGPLTGLGTGRSVTLMRRGTGRIGSSIGPTSRWVTIDALRRGGVEMLTGVVYERIEPGVVRIRDADGAPRRIPAEAVIVCAGQEPDRGLADRLAVLGVPHLVIGGAARAGELDAERAFREGAETPGRVGALLPRG
ncbi:MAG TPA: FAD-dependent oxidoreductase [Solirubrobacteraceae bacterium]|nr:FAD-dependent oxidoreductase [Solirubrobacteraceae bacterium]